MSKFNHSVSTFQAGEVSPRLYGRSDVQQYNQSCKTLLNMYTLSQGGAQSRAGTQFIAELNNNLTKYYRALPFTAANGTKFNIIMVEGLDTAWYVLDTVGAIISLGVLGFGINWTAQQIKEAQYAQSGDYLAVVHGAQPPRGIVFDGINFKMDLWDKALVYNPTTEGIAKRHPFGDVEIGNVNGRGSLQAGAAGPGPAVTTLTSSAGIFTPSWVGTIIKLTNAAVTQFVTVSTYTSATVVNISIPIGVTITTAAVGIAAGTSWEEEAWSVKNGYPRAVCFFEGRIYYAGSTRYPNRVWASQVGNIASLMYRPFEQMTEFATFTSDNSRPYSFDNSSTEASLIYGLSPGKKLAILTSNREYVAGGISDVLGLRSFDVKPATSFGSAYTQPIRSNNDVMFIQRSKKRIRSMTFSFQEDDYKSDDMTKLAEHIVRDAGSKLVSPNEPAFMYMQLQTAPDARIWAIDNNGGLLSCTLDRDGQVLAWSRHILGGKLGTGAPKVISLSVLPSADNSADEVWIVVQRTLNSIDYTTIEKIGAVFEGTTLVVNPAIDDVDTRPIFLDCCRYGIEPVTPKKVWTIDSRFAFEVVSIVADGAYLGDFTLDASGAITLVNNAYEVIAGFKYDKIVQPLGLEVTSPTGTSQGLTKNADTLTIRFVRTVNALYAKAEDKEFTRIKFREQADISGQPPALFTGDKRVLLSGYSRDISPTIKQDWPYPFEVSCIIANGQSYD